MYTNTLNKSFLLLAVVSTAFVSGCATSQSSKDVFLRDQQKAGVVYAQVDKVIPGIEGKSDCEKTDGTERIKEIRSKICGRLNEVNWVRVTTLKNKALFNNMEIVPSTMTLKIGSIVRLDTSKEVGFRFVDVAAYEETETCKWMGSGNDLADDKLTTAGKVVGGFVAGALVLPAAAFYATDRQGGVECNGWSYKTAYSDYLRSN
ncbi:hypothetical protein [Limnohabitans sp. TEGF004]|uniref:hypothetical protein n=1 Tax=Limnohabitans sp. TEGF004 TaxID=2986281 RepID=UPI002376FFB0|nr:hypothetical protein [Limnohabitans sp. TEGF004]BDU56981.1 hypothetical protein LTEGF4_26620 [Limnohabitans sp. TEGF004]